MEERENKREETASDAELQRLVEDLVFLLSENEDQQN